MAERPDFYQLGKAAARVPFMERDNMFLAVAGDGDLDKYMIFSSGVADGVRELERERAPAPEPAPKRSKILSSGPTPSSKETDMETARGNYERNMLESILYRKLNKDDVGRQILSKNLVPYLERKPADRNASLMMYEIPKDDDVVSFATTSQLGRDATIEALRAKYVPRRPKPEEVVTEETPRDRRDAERIRLLTSFHAPSRLDSLGPPPPPPPPPSGPAIGTGRYAPRLSEDEFILPFSDSQGYQNFGFGRFFPAPFHPPEERRLNPNIGNLL
jgi:hypothetical protein